MESSKKPITAHVIVDGKKHPVRTMADVSQVCYTITRKTSQARVRPDGTVWQDGQFVGKLEGKLQ